VYKLFQVSCRASVSF